MVFVHVNRSLLLKGMPSQPQCINKSKLLLMNERKYYMSTFPVMLIYICEHLHVCFICACASSSLRICVCVYYVGVL